MKVLLWALPILLSGSEIGWSAVSPNPALTPGALCSASNPDFQKFDYPERIARCNRNIGLQEKQEVAKNYGNIPEASWPNYEFDHLIPLCAGGANAIENLWPQPISEAHSKDQLEDEICIAMRAGSLSQSQAVQKVHDWFQKMRAAQAPSSRFRRVIEIVFENTNYEKALAQPDFAKLKENGALLTNLIAETHPSQGNYISMIAGDSLGVSNDNPVNLSGQHLGDLLENANLRWRVYAEDFPGSCFEGSKKGNYVRKHNPFISFVSVAQNRGRCGNIVGAEEFDRDVNANLLSEFSFFVPNLKSDGHDTGVDFAGKWFSQKFGSLLTNQAFMNETLLVITFDENEGKGENRVFTVLLGGAVVPGSTCSTALSHASILRLIEDEFNLGSLGRQDQTSNLIEGIWK